MSETIYLTINEQETVINLAVTEESPINVNFYDIAIPDSRVAQALADTIEARDEALEALADAEAVLAQTQAVVDLAIDAEATTRAAADTTLQNNINAEATARVAADALLIPLTQKGQASGVAPLDSSSLIPTQYLPGYVDDVLEYANTGAFPATGESGKIYVALDTLRTYRWGGSSYAEVSPSAVTSVNGSAGVVVLTTTNISEGTNQYFTTARAKSAAVVNSTAGSETDQAPSVSAIKTYVLANVGTPGDGTITKAKLATGAKDLTISTKTSAYTLTGTDELILADATSAAFTLTLPAASGISGRVFIIKKIDSTANKVTIDGNGAETIDGSATVDIVMQYQSFIIVSNGTNWVII